MEAEERHQESETPLALRRGYATTTLFWCQYFLEQVLRRNLFPTRQFYTQKPALRGLVRLESGN